MSILKLIENCYNVHYHVNDLDEFIMTVKSERITILSTPDFKAYLSAEAKREGVSISELVRLRCKRESLDQDEQVLQELIKQAMSSTAKARKSLDKGMKDARRVLKELQNR